jgi:hypothetical protein
MVTETVDGSPFYIYQSCSEGRAQKKVWPSASFLYFSFPPHGTRCTQVRARRRLRLTSDSGGQINAKGAGHPWHKHSRHSSKASGGLRVRCAIIANRRESDARVAFSSAQGSNSYVSCSHWTCQNPQCHRQFCGVCLLGYPVTEHEHSDCTKKYAFMIQTRKLVENEGYDAFLAHATRDRKFIAEIRQIQAARAPRVATAAERRTWQWDEQLRPRDSRSVTRLQRTAEVDMDEGEFAMEGNAVVVDAAPARRRRPSKPPPAPRLDPIARRKQQNNDRKSRRVKRYVREMNEGPASRLVTRGAVCKKAGTQTSTSTVRRCGCSPTRSGASGGRDRVGADGPLPPAVPKAPVRHPNPAGGCAEYVPISGAFRTPSCFFGPLVLSHYCTRGTPLRTCFAPPSAHRRGLRANGRVERVGQEAAWDRGDCCPSPLDARAHFPLPVHRSLACHGTRRIESPEGSCAACCSRFPVCTCFQLLSYRR